MNNQPNPYPSQPTPAPNPPQGPTPQGPTPPQAQAQAQTPPQNGAPLAFGTQPPITNTIGHTSAPPHADRVLRNDRIRIVALVFTSLFSVLFLVLFVNMFIQWSTLNTDIEGQVAAKVATEKAEIEQKLESEFEEREKSPYYQLLGPEDYGSLTVIYPRTWSVYVDNDASNGGDYIAYLNPGQVNHVANDTINALRISILNKSYDSVIQEYQKSVEAGTLNVSIRPINGQNANVYEGELPGTGGSKNNSGLIGAVAIFAIRDKTVVLQTDASVFLDDFNIILDNVTYNK